MCDFPVLFSRFWVCLLIIAKNISKSLRVPQQLQVRVPTSQQDPHCLSDTLWFSSFKTLVLTTATILNCLHIQGSSSYTFSFMLRKYSLPRSQRNPTHMILALSVYTSPTTHQSLSVFPSSTLPVNKDACTLPRLIPCSCDINNIPSTSSGLFFFNYPLYLFVSSVCVHLLIITLKKHAILPGLLHSTPLTLSHVHALLPRFPWHSRFHLSHFSDQWLDHHSVQLSPVYSLGSSCSFSADHSYLIFSIIPFPASEHYLRSGIVNLQPAGRV